MFIYFTSGKDVGQKEGGVRKGPPAGRGARGPSVGQRGTGRPAVISGGRGAALLPSGGNHIPPGYKRVRNPPSLEHLPRSPRGGSL